MTRDELLKGCIPAGVCMNPIGRNLNELSVEEFEQNYKTIFKSVFEIGQADISAFNGFGELDEDNQPQSKTLKEFLVDTFDDEGDDYWYHWKELFETSRMTKEFFDRYYEKMLQAGD